MAAESAITHAIELDPNNALAHSYYAELLILQNNAGQGTIGTIEKAHSEANLALALAPDTMDAHRALGIVYLNTNNLDLAIQEFQSAIAIDGNIADLHLRSDWHTARKPLLNWIRLSRNLHCQWT